MNIRKRTWKYLLSALGLLALGVLCVVWWRTHAYGAPGRIAALLSLALFAVLGLRTVPELVDFCAPDGEELCVPGDEV